MKIGLIGFGHLAQSLVKGLLSKDQAVASQLLVADVDEGALSLAQDLGLGVFQRNADLARQADLIILGVKPGQEPGVIKEIGENIGGKVLISLLAGTSLASLEDLTSPGQAIIRAMPSIAMEVCQSLTALTPNSQAQDSQIDQVQGLFSQLGTSLVTSEEDLERVSVISGSGLGYAAYIIAGLAQAAQAIGYEEGAEEAVIQVMAGATGLLKASGTSPMDMAGAVATEGGTTIEGLRVMEKEGLDQILTRAMEASYAKVKAMKE